MFAAVGVTVSRLMRVRYGPVSLPASLKRGQCYELEPAEVQALLKALQEKTSR
jgi:23S rRNA pseudouridine2605 synthase